MKELKFVEIYFIQQDSTWKDGIWETPSGIPGSSGVSGPSGIPGSSSSSSIDYSEYIAKNITKNIDYSEYIAKNITKNIDYSEYIAKNLENGRW
jgi:hypothetical protein